MVMPRVIRQLRIALPLAFALVMLLPAVASWAQVQPFEMGIAGREAGLLRGLSQRLSKENLLYQLHLGDVRKEELLRTSAEIDRIIDLLGTGSASYAVPEPWTAEIRTQLAATEAAWAVLQPIATASPYDYLRRTRQFMPAADRRGDPLSIRYFDNLSNALSAEAGKLLTVYEVECLQTDFPNCLAARSSGLWAMLTERMVKHAVMVFAGIDVAISRESLDADRAQLGKLLADARNLPLIQDAMAPDRGERGAFVAGLLGQIDSDWQAFGLELDLVVNDDDHDLDVDRLLLIEDRMIGEMQRLNSTITRFAIARYGS